MEAIPWISSLTFFDNGSGSEDKYYIIWIIRFFLSLSLSLSFALSPPSLFLFMVVERSRSHFYESRFLLRHRWNFDTDNKRVDFWNFAWSSAWTEILQLHCDNNICEECAISRHLCFDIDSVCARRSIDWRTSRRNVRLIELTSSRWVYQTQCSIVKQSFSCW